MISSILQCKAESFCVSKCKALNEFVIYMFYVELIWKNKTTNKCFQTKACTINSGHLQLIQHRRMHTGEKPHLCPHCIYRSARRDNLRSHVRRVHKKDNLFCDTFSPRGFLLSSKARDINKE